MVEFLTGFGAIIVLCVIALVIDLFRPHGVVDNSSDYRRMFEQGLLKHTEKRKRL